MKIKYKNNNVTIGNGKETFAKIHFQEGSLLNHKENGVKDIDVLKGLIMYLQDMNKQHKSALNNIAVEGLKHIVGMLAVRRSESHRAAQIKATMKGGKQ